jgi:beta-lactamase regulating signal transducer with metallopeptidase domain
MTLWRHWIVGQLDASLVAAVLLALAVLLRHRLAPRVRSAILLIALIRLVLPPWLRSPWSEALVDVPPLDEGRSMIAIAVQWDPVMHVAAFTSIVAVFLLVRTVWVFTTAERRWISRTQPAPLPPLPGVHVRVSRNGEGPLAVGLRKKLVVLPETALHLDAGALDAVLAHELAHHHRRDLWWIAGAEVLKAIAWFNPLAHMIARALVASREDGSDDLAISMTSKDPFAYAGALLKTARVVSELRPMGVAGAHPMGARMRRLLDGSATREGHLGLFGLMLIMACAAAAIPGAHMPEADSGGERRVVVIHRRT